MRILALIFPVFQVIALATVTLAGGQGPSGRDGLVWLKYIEAQGLAAEGLESGNSQKLEEAILALRETIRLDPTAAEPHVDLGNLYLFGKGELDRAASEAREAIRLSPDNVGGHLLLGRLACLARWELDGIQTSPSLSEPAPVSSAPSLSDAISAAYRRVVELEPSQSEGWLVLQTVYEAKREFDDQINALERYLGAPPIGPENVFVQRLFSQPLSEDQAWFKLSQLYLRRGSYEPAVGAGRRAYESRPEIEAYANNFFELTGMAPSRQAEVQLLRQALAGFVPGSSNHSELVRRYATALIRAGQEAEALQLIRNTTVLEAGERASLSSTALRRLNRREEALVTLNLVIKTTARGPRLLLQYEAAQTLEELGRDREAVVRYEQLFDQLLAAGPRVLVSNSLLNRTVERLYGLYQRNGTEARLRILLKRTRRVVDEQNPLLDQISVQALVADGRLDEALTVAQAATRRYRDDPSWLITESSLLAELGRVVDSVQMIEAAIIGTTDSAGDDSALHLQLATIYRRQGDLVAAQAAARRAIELSNSDPRRRDRLVSAQLLLASILHQQGAWKESTALWREILHREPAEATALSELGYFLLESRQSLDEARNLIERAVAIDPLNSRFLDRQGWLMLKLGRKVEARRTLQRALTLSPRDALINEHLAELLDLMGQTEQARLRRMRLLKSTRDSSQIERLRKSLKILR